MTDKLKGIDTSWSLFLDRDGVINHQKEGGYILTWDDFIFYEGAIAAMRSLASHFKYIFIVTNQRGVGKGLMEEKELQHIHHFMKRAIELADGKIDGIYYCTEMDSPNRKPNPGMAHQAQKDFPDVDFSKSIIAGNSMSDMEFGRNIGATNIFIASTKPEIDREDKRIDAVYNSLEDFAKALQSLR
jgi:D-glycero-D-manno-heptose 1,7-bisphosphate phosphatase